MRIYCSSTPVCTGTSWLLKDLVQARMYLDCAYFIITEIASAETCMTKEAKYTCRPARPGDWRARALAGAGWSTANTFLW